MPNSLNFHLTASSCYAVGSWFDSSITEKKVDMEMTVSIKNDMRKAASLENGAIKTKSQPRSRSMSTQR